MNRYYNYLHKELWEDHAWDDRFSQLVPLAREIDRLNLEQNRIVGKPEGERRTDGLFDPKAHSLTYPEVKEYWEKRGLSYYCASMATSAWVAMIPLEQIGRKGYDHPMDTLIVLVNADFKDPSWCMYILEKYKGYVEAAAEEKYAILFIATDIRDEVNQYISIIQEAVVLFHLNYHRFFLDVGSVYRAGMHLKDIPDFVYYGDEGSPVYDADTQVRLFGKAEVPVLDASGRWQNKDSLIYKLIRSRSFSNEAYDYDALIHSEIGRKLAEGMALEMNYDSADDPDLLKYWDYMGLRCDFHEKDGEQWIMFLPKQALDEPEKKIPVVCIFQEVNRFDPHQAITGFSYCYQYMKIAAQGDCMLLYFVLESIEDNELLHEILEEAEVIYPMLDRSRVYLTGHSHDGRFTAEYARRHPMDIAGMATLGNEPGQIPPQYTSGIFQVTDEQIQRQASFDIPTINISGYVERNSQFPLHSDASNVRPGQRVALDTFEKRAESWQRRLLSARCPMKTLEEIKATKDSPDYVERMLGIPADKTDMLYLDGSENYIADIKNVDGRYHLRIVALGNMTHTVTPAMIDFSWSFLRRFARNQESGECVELY